MYMFMPIKDGIVTINDNRTILSIIQSSKYKMDMISLITSVRRGL